MRKFLLSVAAALALWGSGQAQISPDAYQRWYGSKYSMFIHFGLYSELGGVWEGKPVTAGYSEQIQSFAGIFSDWYGETALRFNPTRFNADEIVALAKEAGMRSIVITTKHHDGFCMFRTATTDYNSWEATPVPRDFVKELADACRRGGLRLGLYYSNIDWHFPQAYPISSHNCDFVTPEHFELSKAQIRELLTNYGPISELWFDMGSHTPEQSREMYNLVHELQPDCMVSGRLGNDAYDFSVMADNKYPESALQVAWQTAASMFDETWSYRSWQERGSAVDKAEEKLRSLLGVVSHGGNFLLNIGPKGDGSVVPFEREVLQRIGKWMGKYGEAIYETEASPYRQSFEWGYITRKGTKMYLIVSDDYKAGQVQIPMPADNKLLSARSLVGGNALKFTQEKATYWIDTPAKEGDTYAVAELTFASEVEPMPMAALRKSGALVLSQENATPSYSYSCYDYYTNYRSTVAFNWETELKRALRSAEIIYTQQQSNRELSFSIDGESAGTITLNAGKPYDLKVKPGSVRMGAAKWQGPSFGLFDGNIADWAEKEGTPTEKSEGTIPTTILKNYFLTQEIESDKDQDVLFELRSGNGVEVVLNGQTFSKHLNPYRCTLRDEQILLPLRKGKNTVVIRFYNRFEKEMPWRFALAEKQVVLKQDALVALPAGRHTLSVAPAQPRSIHADIELSDIKIIYK